MRLDQTLFEKAVGLFLIAGLVLACWRIVAPFLGAVAWATILAVSTWPLFVRLRQRLGGRRKLAAAVMTAALALAFVVPVVLVVMSLKDGVESLAAAAQDLTALKLPDLPAWVAGLPVVGGRIAKAWRSAQGDTGATLEVLRPYIRAGALWLLAEGAKLGLALLEFLLAVFLAGLLYVTGEGMADLVRRCAARIDGDRGVGLVQLSAQTIRGVSLSVIGTALVQALLSAISFAVVGVPGVALLGLFSFIFAMLQVGTAPVWILVALWLAYQGHRGAALFVVASGILINILDNFMKPYFLGRQGAGPPVMVIFVGVLGGLMAWGFIGVFLGATLLAVGYTLLRSWLDEAAA